MVVNRCALLLVGELFELRVVRQHALSAPKVGGFELLRCGGQTALEDLAAATSFLLTDVSRVRPASDHHAPKEECEVAIVGVVERVWFVPLWELTDVLMGQRRLVAHFLIALGTTATVHKAMFSKHSDITLTSSRRVAGCCTLDWCRQMSADT